MNSVKLSRSAIPDRSTGLSDMCRTAGAQPIFRNHPIHQTYFRKPGTFTCLAEIDLAGLSNHWSRPNTARLTCGRTQRSASLAGIVGRLIERGLRIAKSLEPPNILPLYLAIHIAVALSRISPARWFAAGNPVGIQAAVAVGFNRIADNTEMLPRAATCVPATGF